MKLNNIQNIKNLDLFTRVGSLKEWNFKNLEGFLIKDGFYFNEYGKVDTNNIITEFIKKNKKKGQFLYDIVKKGDISLNFTGHVTCASWLGYTLDKISFISLGHRKKVNMIEIYTDDGNNITLTRKMKVLTNSGYKEAHTLKENDEIIGIIGNSYNGFKNGGNSKKNFIDIHNLLINIKNEILSKNKDCIELKELDKKHSHYLNIIGINSSRKVITIQDINILIDNIEGNKDNDDGITDIDNLLSNSSSKKNIFIRKVKKVIEVEIIDGYIGSIVSKLSQNYIINNIILKK